MHTLTLTPPARASSRTRMILGQGAIGEFQKTISKNNRFVILYDRGVESLVKPLLPSLSQASWIPVESGDTSKSLTEVERIVEAMLQSASDRRTQLIAVGGGMMTDLGGFVASIFMRGIPCVLIPTTLLGMVDAAIGGKTAVNAGNRKNMLGTITHPELVVIDTTLLQTLPETQCAEGLAEMIKIAAIADRPYFDWLEQNLSRILAREKDALDDAVLRAVQAKIRIVEADDQDRDVRLLLNFGHTVGHAVEALSEYTLAHGRAVSIGMCAEMTLSGFAHASRVRTLLTQAALPVSLPAHMKQSDLWRIMLSDKKNEDGGVRIAVPHEIGEGVVSTVTETAFTRLFDA